MNTKDPTTKPVTASYISSHCSNTCKKLFLDEASADVKFFFTPYGSQPHFLAHKFLLANGSSVFKQMFYGGVKKVEKIYIKDATFNEFKEFSQIFYLDKITLTIENVGGVLRLAKEYDVTECISLCEKFLQEYLSAEKVCSILDLAITFDRPELAKHCHRIIREHSAAVFASDSFHQCSQQVLKEILKRGDLNCSAKEIFDACIDWAEQKCAKNDVDASKVVNLKKQLGKCLYLIPFHLMCHKELNECLSVHKTLFTQEELIEIISIITLGPSCLNDLKKFKPKVDFQTKEQKLTEPLVEQPSNKSHVAQISAKIVKRSLDPTLNVSSAQAAPTKYRIVTAVPQSMVANTEKAPLQIIKIKTAGEKQFAVRIAAPKTPSAVVQPQRRE